MIELATGKNIKIASEPVYSPLNLMRANWSPDSRWLAYTVQESHYVGGSATGGAANPDARRVWLDNDIRADYGRFASDRRHVLA